MKLVRLMTFTILLVMVDGVTGVTAEDKDFLTLLLKRIETLETNDRGNKREIAELKATMFEMKVEFQIKEVEFNSEINKLKAELQLGDQTHDQGASEEVAISKGQVEVNGNQPNEERQEVKVDNGKKYEGDAPRKIERSMKVRSLVENEVAFYATHTEHDVLHLGQNQIIIFNETVSNIGNAYNPHHGAFVAPVDGTYIFHVTLMSHHSPSGHYSAYIDVDDVPYSNLYVVPYDQSSQMLVIELKSGSTVSVKNNHVDDGMIGQHYSSFSGFLLYQHFQSSGAIIGK